MPDSAPLSPPSGGSQFIIGLVAALALGAAGGYMIMRPYMDGAKSMTGQARAIRGSVAVIERHKDTPLPPNPIADPLANDAERVAAIMKRLNPGDGKLPTPAQASDTAKLNLAIMLAAAGRACEGTTDATTKRVVAAAMNESDRLAAEGITFPLVEIALEQQVSRCDDPALSQRLLNRALETQKDASKPTLASRALHRTEIEKARTRLLSATELAQDEERAFRASESAGALSGAMVLAAEGKLPEAEQAYRQAWESIASNASEQPSGFAIASVGNAYARFLLANDQASKALDVVLEVEQRLRSRGEARDTKAFVRCEALKGAVLRKLGRTLEAEWIAKELELRMDLETLVAARARGPELGAAMAELGQYQYAEELYWKDLLCAWLAQNEHAGIDTVRGVIEFAETSPEAAAKVKDVLPVYTRWLNRHGEHR